MGYLTSIWQNVGGSLQKINSASKKNIQLIVDKRFSIILKILVNDLILKMITSNMLHPSIQPPESVKGMTTLIRTKFNKTVKVPGFKMLKKDISLTQKGWKPLLLKLKGIKPVACLDNNDPLKESHNLILLDPAKIYDSRKTDGLLDKLQKFGFSPETLGKYELELGYENWSVSDVMKAVLPEDGDSVSSFTQIGHIAHLNLKDENLTFKHLIGEVIIDKVPSVKTVVNKLNSIDNTYRNFEMELLAGENNFVTQTREHNCVFELDFSKVYWNSRLSTEHQRIVDIIPRESIVYDIFAGVGPFTVPLAKKKDCTIFANDLNPHSFGSLKKNIELNKLKNKSVEIYNMDGRDFIRNVVKSDLIKRIEETHSKQSENELKDNIEIHEEKPEQSLSTVPDKDKTYPATYVVMNLPALAVDFLDSFVALLSDLPVKFKNTELLGSLLPIVHCYAFCSKCDDMEEEVKKRAESIIGQSLPPNASVRIVRNVSPNKEMVCLSFKLWTDLVLSSDSKDDIKEDCLEPSNKRLKSS